MNLNSVQIGALTTILITNFVPAEVDFSHEIVPILKEHCAKCHTNGKYKGSLSMDTREALLKSESVIVGNAAESPLIQVLLEEDPEDRMPQKADPLSPEKIAMLTKWLEEGLSWEPGFTFKEQTWVAPLAHRKPKLPPETSKDENPIDRIARAYFERNKIVAPGIISDATFLRRIYLDLLGILPPPSELHAFKVSKSPAKRSEKIAELLDRRIDFADHWMAFWNDLLRNDYAGTGFIDGGRKQITGWLYKSLVDNKPYDQFVRELMDPSGDSEGFIKGIKWRGNVNASQVPEIQYAQNVSQIFFGENLKCASCHDSFINDWKLADAYGMAAIIAGKPLEMFRCDKATGEFADAKFLFDSLGEIDSSASRADRLKRAAELSTADGNGRLARTVVNRIWARLMGRGLVEPVDMMGNRPWSEDMLDYLAWDLAHNGYDLKRTFITITNSRAYQNATVTPPAEAEDYIFKGPIAKRMTAEQFIDAVWEITGTAPPKISASVERGHSEPIPKIPGAWIWSGAGNRSAGETVVFTRALELPDTIAAATIAITCDNEYSLTINGKLVGGDAHWESIETFDVLDRLRPGKNTIQVVGKNLGNGSNPAALYACLRVGTAADTLTLTTDRKWLADGKAATELSSSPWGKNVNAQIATHLSPEPDPNSSNPRSVRASLVNSTLLMRALGRPNREQVVTTRPAELTTLQALELNNGAEFVDYLDRGAAKWFKDQEDLVDRLYLTAVSRLPSRSERSVANEILGSPVSQEGVGDLLWALLMLPEFQFVN